MAYLVAEGAFWSTAKKRRYLDIWGRFSGENRAREQNE
jgi:hypothetical protein